MIKPYEYNHFIKPIDRRAQKKAMLRWDGIAKPLQSLGKLETMVIRLCGIEKTPDPTYRKKAVVIMCADNGIVGEGVTQTEAGVTAEVAENFLAGKATVNAFARVCGADVIPVDVGMNTEIPGMLQKKYQRGTRNFTMGPAMDYETACSLIAAGADMVRELKEKGYNLIITGEMGIGNTTTSSAVLSVLTNTPPESVTGRGAGLSNEALKKKIAVIRRGIEKNCPSADDAVEVLAKVGGFDLCAIAGLFIGGGVYRVPVIIDGFISAAAALAAVRIAPGCRDYMFASHLSKEPASALLMKTLKLDPYIDCEMCLGEGTGGVIGAKLFDFALAAYREPERFENVSFDRYQMQEGMEDNRL